ncbi:ras GEF [Rhizoclosmatium globosum]|uniref:Ras GEF n=1 Tax=Rhizoclosmatium globosum TaxID=329046 RepID=A0A1Y2BT81_9FUNG|nr:ras GEF [Rhizoclosmatium globosum]|eukprot:ORY37958.1 ras GEF [Rhizoclosmatium globosum]
MIFSTALLSVWPKYATASDFLGVLLDLFDEFETPGQVHPIQLRIAILVSTWTSTSFDRDFRCNKPALTLLKVFHSTLVLLTSSTNSNATHATSLVRYTNLIGDKLFPRLSEPPLKHRQEYNSTLVDSEITPTIFQTIRPKSQSWCEAFLAIDSASIAAQLTYLESRIFCAIDPYDLFVNAGSCKWDKVGMESRRDVLSTVDTSVGHFNFVSAWVITRVLMGRKPKSRAKMIHKFIQIALELKSINNFNTLMSVISGLTSTPIDRLKQTQTLLQQQHLYSDGRDSNPTLFDAIRDLERLMSQEKLFSRYRKALTDAPCPCIPYLGVITRDLIYIEEGNKDVLSPTGEVNLSKAVMIADIVLTIQWYQDRPHQIQRDHGVLGMILESTALTTEQAYALSLELEPRQVDSVEVVEKVALGKKNSGFPFQGKFKF